MLITIDGVLSKEEVRAFRAQLDPADWIDGASTAGSLARSQKTNSQLDDQAPVAVALGEQLLRRLGSIPLFISAALPNKIYPPKFNRYAGGDAYGAHVDSALMRAPRGDVTLRCDLSATLFLSEPDEYEGGELQIESAFGAQAVKLAAGDMVLYPASSLHRVTPVTEGARVASFFWIESHVADEGQRSLLFDLDQAIQGLTLIAGGGSAELLRLTGVYHNLLRRWAST
jgi:PKHD-type hydroxylase